MQVIISARGMTISSAYRAALAGKLAKIEPLLPKIIETKAVLSKEKHRHTVALTLVAKHHTFRSAETAGELGVAVDLAVDALARQVRETKDRIKNRKARPARRPRPGPPTGAAAAAPRIAVRQIPLKPMSVEEAVSELGRVPDGFVVFTNASTEAVSVLCRRTDGELELIEPVA